MFKISVIQPKNPEWQIVVSPHEAYLLSAVFQAFSNPEARQHPTIPVRDEP
jgi:hypothetical protein